MRPRAPVLSPAAAALLAGALLLATAATPRAAAQRGRFEATEEVVLVEVPVQVLRDGEPVRGLTAADFEVFDGRRKQQIVGFEVIDLARAAAAAAPVAVTALPVAARRHFLLLFDLSFSEPSAVVRARRAAADLVVESLHPADLVAVATYSESRGPDLVLGFTADRTQVRAAIDTLGVADPNARAVDALGLVLDTGGGLAPGGAGAEGGLRSSNDDLVLDQLRALSNLSGRAARDQAQGQVMALSSSLAQLAGLLRGVEGRKYVVFLSEGFDTSVVLGTSGSTEEEQERIEQINEAAAAGEFWKVDSEERFGSTSSLNVVTQMLDEFRRADCVIQAVDIGGLRAGGAVEGRRADAGVAAPGQDGLFLMANETGGELYRNFNDLGGAMEQMLARTSVTYVLAFQPQGLKLDGRFHGLRVELAGPQRGARVVHRPGYYAPRPYTELSAAERRIAAAGRIVGGEEGGDLATSLLAAPVRVAGQKSYVPVLVEVDGDDLLAGHQGKVIPTEVYAYALSREGAVLAFFSQALGLDTAQATAVLRQSGFKYWGHFDLDPGDYVVRVLVRNGETGRAGLASVPLRVPAFERAEAALLPPLFPEPPGKWLLGREQAKERRQVPYPFMRGGEAFIPAALPAVKRGGEAEVCLMGYGLAPGVTVASRLLRADGAAVEGWRLEVRERTAAGGADQLLATFRAGEVAAGSYTLVVTVAGAAGEAEHTASIPVLVEG